MFLMDRRAFIKTAGALFVANLSPASALALTQSDAVFASSYKAPDGSFGVATLSENGAIIHRYALPDRGHDIVRHPHKNEMVAFARRPGTFAVVIDYQANTQPRIITAVEGRHFYGHGLYAPDGELLFATENDYDNARGVIGIYETRNNYRRIGEFDAFGIGPHDMDVLPDGETLVIANGGIETHPDFPRTKLNIPTMKPNLVFIDLKSGALKSKFELPEHMRKLSTRHLAMLGDTVWFACQNQGDVTEALPLIGRVSLNNGTISMLDIPENITASMRGYIGSIAANAESGLIGFTSPRGGMAYQLSAATDQIVLTSANLEVSGIAPSKQSFCFSNGEGQFADHKSEYLWDNHIEPLKEHKNQVRFHL